MWSKKSFALLLTVLTSCQYMIQGVYIITKVEWGGRKATYTDELPNNQNYTIIHHTVGSYCNNRTNCEEQLRSLQNYQMDSLGWPDIRYNFLIGGDGNVYEGRGWNNVGGHATNWNSKSIGISFVGDYNKDKLNPSQISAAKGLLTDAVARGQITPGYILYGHRQVGATNCPGINIWNEIRNWDHWSA